MNEQPGQGMDQLQMKEAMKDPSFMQFLLQMLRQGTMSPQPPQQGITPAQPQPQGMPPPNAMAQGGGFNPNNQAGMRQPGV